MPDLPASSGSPHLYDRSLGYEIKPFAVLDGEARNSDGFRGPERAFPKPADVYRILAIGDSVVESAVGRVPYEQTWEKVLEDSLGRASDGVESTAPVKRYEVINAGIGGYVSAQALARLQNRGLKYEPDLVVVLVGSNDLYFSWLPDWHPDITMNEIPAAWGDPAPDLWRLIKRHAARFSFVVRLIRQALRARESEGDAVRPISPPPPPDHALPFNDAALERYVLNVERIRDLLVSRGSRMAVVAYPFFLATSLLDDLRTFPVPPTVQDFVDGYLRYIGAIRSFAERHPAVVLIDASEAFSARTIEQQASLFLDFEHLSPAGNRLLADLVRARLQQRKL